MGKAEEDQILSFRSLELVRMGHHLGTTRVLFHLTQIFISIVVIRIVLTVSISNINFSPPADEYVDMM